MNRDGRTTRGRRWTRRSVSVWSIASLVIATLAWPAAADTIWWTASGSTHLSFASLDGTTTVPGTLDSGGATVSTPWGIAFDPAAGKVYWANSGGNKISWANLDGSGGADLNTSGATVTGPIGLVVDHAAGKVYWANSNANKISWARLDGSGGGDLNTTGATVTKPIGVALDKAHGRIYWGSFDANKISSARLDGSGGGSDLATTGAVLNGPEGVAIDQATGRIFWANNNADSLGYARLDGSGGGALATTGASTTGPILGAIDPDTRRVYWINRFGSGLSYASADGSGGTNSYAITFGAAPALLKKPSAAGAPAASGGSALGSTLACSRGTWGADLLGNLAYRAPRTFGYQWTRNGTIVPGATASTLAARVSGQYRCRVTATNHAGSTTQTSAARAVAPNTVIVKAGVRRSRHQATFAFKGAGGATRFQCMLKKGRKAAVYRACTSPRTYRHLTRGSYAFFVRAIGSGGADPTPARYRFRI